MVTRSAVALLFCTAFALLTQGCQPASQQFALPPGDAAQGQANFASMQCNACHSVGTLASQSVVGIDIPIGGKTTKVQSYAALVSSIINPSHRIKPMHKAEGQLEDGTSAMQNYNETMTVQQLIDLVTYLQAQYELVVPVNYYPSYY